MDPSQAQPPPDADLARRQELLGRWQASDDVDALDELLRLEVGTLAQGLRHRARDVLRPSVSASDVAQEATYRLLRKQEPPRFSSPAELRAYLWKTAWNLLVDRLRRRGRDVVSLERADTRELEVVLRTTGGISAVERGEQAQAMALMLALLSPQDREVLERVYMRHEPIEEAAAALGITRAACDMRLTRARRRLAERMLSWTALIG